jgi:hypothetical protein
MNVRKHFTKTSPEPSILRNSQQTVFQYIHITTQHLPSAPIQKCHYGTFIEEKGIQYITLSMNRNVGGGMMPSAHNGN